jgi:hypothetical protein
MDGRADINASTDSDFARLKGYASEVLTAETAELPLLDQIASLASEIATRCREQSRQRRLAGVTQGAAALFATPTDDLGSRLTDLPLDELTSLEQLLEQASAARSALAEADGALMAAHRRGDFAAMAPLALEADRQKSALAATGAQFASRAGIDATLRSDAPAEPEVLLPAGGATVAAEGLPPAAALPESVADADSGAPEMVADQSAATPDAAVDPLEESERRPSTTERRRLRDLIRQVRPVTEESVLT